ncbi:proline-rich protein PRCC [Microplitis demolitor]|uniref:proline-rich protein PRCC n=1 Tax=Microplitis demolitor TaxID=69319 RepID=UPI0004CD425E|nr:proline-rich protein PRCC [Microplitis demolitor]
MSLAGLVEYESSDESENEDCPEENTVKIVTNTANSDNLTNDTKIIQSNNKTKLHLPEPVQKIKEKTRLELAIIVDNSSNNLAFDILPKPITELTNNVEIEEEEDDDFPIISMKKITIEKPVKKIKGPVKISIPSLSDFDDIDGPSSNLANNKIQPSMKLPGLLSSLPPPKGELMSTKNMIPYVLTKNSTTTTALTPTQIKNNAQTRAAINKKVIEKPKVSKALELLKYTSDSEDEEDVKTSSTTSIDFFSLSNPVNLPISEQALASHSLPMLEKMDTLESVARPKNDIEEPESINENQRTLTSTVMNLPRDEIILKNKAEVGPKLPVPEQEFHLDNDGNIAFDDKAIEYLCGKRGIKRKDRFINESEIIDINGEDIKPDEREWLVKALTEEPVQRPISLSSGPSGQSKKKHQITYLAHQAKAMDLELQNRWAANKLARNQTRSKYGF